MLYGNLKNGDMSQITVTGLHNSGPPWEIDSGERVEVIWYQSCVMINDGTTTKYFDSWPVPKNTIQPNMFSSSIDATYKNGSLYYETKDGNLLQAQEISSCGDV